jgi:Icc-related predicted phosphoesterase
MRLISLADTHNMHADIPIPDGDIIIHAGDCTDGGTRNETANFLKWFSQLPHKHKILVPGNHDFFFEKPENLKKLPANIHCLIDSGITINGINFWGSPVTPGMGNWAFNRERGAGIRKHWEHIPKDTDVLITHTPPYGILDEIEGGIHLGCEELRYLLGNVEPELHLFGHIHYSAGSVKLSPTQYHNISILDEALQIWQSPLVVDI